MVCDAINCSHIFTYISLYYKTYCYIIKDFHGPEEQLIIWVSRPNLKIVHFKVCFQSF